MDISWLFSDASLTWFVSYSGRLSVTAASPQNSADGMIGYDRKHMFERPFYSMVWTLAPHGPFILHSMSYLCRQLHIAHGAMGSMWTTCFLHLWELRLLFIASAPLHWMVIG